MLRNSGSFSWIFLVDHRFEQFLRIVIAIVRLMIQKKDRLNGKDVKLLLLHYILHQFLLM